MALPGSIWKSLVCLLLVLLSSSPLSAREIPSWLPRYDLDIVLDIAGHQAKVRERVTWTNRHKCQVKKIVFNVHSNYKMPDKDIGFLAKMVELLRLAPNEALDFDGHACQVTKVTVIEAQSPLAQVKGKRLFRSREVKCDYQKKVGTALEVPLPKPLGQGESVTLELEINMRLPPRQGRWGQWKDVTFLAQWLPVVAYHNTAGWQPAPFIPWHQPYFNEAGIYSGKITLKKKKKISKKCAVK